SINNSGSHAKLQLSIAAAECIELFLLRHPASKECEVKARESAYRAIYDAAFRAGNLQELDSSFARYSENSLHASRNNHLLRRAIVRMRFIIPISERIRMLKDRLFSAM